MSTSFYYPTIELAQGAENNGLATMIADLIRQNLEDKPYRLADFFKLYGRVSIVAEDADVALTMEFNRGELLVHDGIVGIPDVTIRADSDDVINMSLIELGGRFDLPDRRGEHFRQMLDATRQKRLQVFGALANIPLLLRLTRVMSIN